MPLLVCATEWWCVQCVSSACQVCACATEGVRVCCQLLGVCVCACGRHSASEGL